VKINDPDEEKNASDREKNDPDGVINDSDGRVNGDYKLKKNKTAETPR